MLDREMTSFHGRRRLLLIGVAILVTSSLVSLCHGVSSSCHHHPSSTSFQDQVYEFPVVRLFLMMFLIFSLCSLILLHFSSLVASLVALHFAMFSTPGLGSVFLRVVFLLLMIPLACIFRLSGNFGLPSLFLSLFSHLVTLFIAGCVSGGFPFRHVLPLQVCGVSVLELWSLLFRALWFFIGIGALSPQLLVSKRNCQLAPRSILNLDQVIQSEVPFP
ncbi:hypothetical protein F2Q68_00009507 [Brassica cretica]|uniref:Uncharacterized protein n=1 Tax=Brassica cretica TaxID=69181 RepID=A0A8S9KTW9_BRACR|nr:hypothetical protein F2Q68_00009507 [Brassica cretica]